MNEAIVRFSKAETGEVVGKYQHLDVFPKFKVLDGEEWEVRLRLRKDGQWNAFKVRPNVAVTIEDDKALMCKLRCGQVEVRVKGKYEVETTKDGFEVGVAVKHPRYGKFFLPIVSFNYSDLLDPCKVLDIVDTAKVIEKNEVKIPPSRVDLVVYAHQVYESMKENLLPAVNDLLLRFLNGDKWFEPLPELPPTPKLRLVKWATTTYSFRTFPHWVKVKGFTSSRQWLVEEPRYEIENLDKIKECERKVKEWWDKLGYPEKVALWGIAFKKASLTLTELATCLREVEETNPVAILSALKENLNARR